MKEALERAKETGPVDVLAIAAHRDDVELTCGGTLLRCADRGHRTAILDLTRGEMGTRGSAQLRGREAEAAARVLGAAVRLNAGLPDAGLFNDDPSRRRLVAFLRALRPTTVILPFPRGRHPDHRIASELGRDACYLAGLTRYDAVGEEPVPEEAGGESGGSGATGSGNGSGGPAGRAEPHRPTKVLYALSYREDPVKPTFVVDIAEQFGRKMEAVRCYASQFDGKDAAGEIYPTGQDLYDLIETQSRHYGSLIRRPYGEPFWTEETVAVDDIVGLSVRSM